MSELGGWRRSSLVGVGPVHGGDGGLRFAGFQNSLAKSRCSSVAWQGPTLRVVTVLAVLGRDDHRRGLNAAAGGPRCTAHRLKRWQGEGRQPMAHCCLCGLLASLWSSAFSPHVTDKSNRDRADRELATTKAVRLGGGDGGEH